MYLKLKPVILFVAVLSISCLSLNFSGVNASLLAQETQTSTKKECPLTSSGTPPCKTAPCKTPPECADTHGCCKEVKTCFHEKRCDIKPGCLSVDDMLCLVHCAKKKLLKEKIMANLETKIGTKLDKVADLLVDTMLEEYKAGAESKERREVLKKKLSEIFTESKNK